MLAILGGLITLPVPFPQVASRIPAVGTVLTPQVAYANECSKHSRITFCGRFVNTSDHGIGMVHSWSSDPQWTRILRPGQSTKESFDWADTDGFYVGRGYRVQVWDPTTRFPIWYYGDACTNFKGRCKRGYHKFPDLPFGMTWYISSIERV